MRVAIGGLWHETNTFAAERTELDAFQQYQFAHGQEIFERFCGTRTEVGGFLEFAKSQDWQLVPSVFAGAVPSGTVARDVFTDLLERLLDPLRNSVDGVLLALHGAMVAEGWEDCEAEILRRAREIIGPVRPLVATFDIHANLSREAVRYADLLVGYDTYPHVDCFERGLEAARCFGELVASDSRPAKAFRKLPMLTVPQTQSTDSFPMKDVMAKLRVLESQRGMMCASVAVGFPYADVRRVGVGVVAYSGDGGQLANVLADDIAQTIWGMRKSFVVQNVPAQEAARRVLTAPEGPVILVDAADNIGGGAPGDGTVLLRALLEGGVLNAVVTLADAEAVGQALSAGLGREVELAVGGKHDRCHGEPVHVKAKVVKITETIYTHRGSYMTGLKVNLGKTAILNCRGVEIMLTERKGMPFDAEQLRSVGIEPAQKRALVVKSAIAWKAAYGDLAKDVIYVETPGICSSDLSRFSYKAIPRPIFPLDEV